MAQLTFQWIRLLGQPLMHSGRFAIRIQKNGFGISCDRSEYLAVIPIHKSGPSCLYLLLTQAYDHLINILSKTWRREIGNSNRGEHAISTRNYSRFRCFFNWKRRYLAVIDTDSTCSMYRKSHKRCLKNCIPNLIEILRIPSKQKESEAESGIKETTLVDRTRHVIIEPLDTLKMYNNMECESLLRCAWLWLLAAHGFTRSRCFWGLRYTIHTENEHRQRFT